MTLPKDWVCEPAEATLSIHAKKEPFGMLSVTAWKTSREPGGLGAFLARKEKELAAPQVEGEQVRAIEPVKLGHVRGLMRVSIAGQNDVPEMITMFFLGTENTLVLATHSIALAEYRTEEGKAQYKIASDIILTMQIH